MYFVLKLGIFVMNVIYWFIKLLPSQKKITMISRQSNNRTFDFVLLDNEIKKDLKGYKVVFLTKRLENGIDATNIDKIKYFFHMFIQMYHIATSKVIILDSYCIVISILKHKKNLTIIQMWHSVGTMKKFGYTILNKKEGSKYKIAKIMQMHKNYDYILASSRNYVKHLEKQFNYNEEYFKIIPLPRIDALIDKNYQKLKKEQILVNYKQLREKTNILYCPTFRKNEKELKSAINKLIKSFDFENYNLIIKLHPLSKIKVRNKKVLICNEYSTMDMLFVSNYIISDYSCIIYEAALLGLPINLYVFDINKYKKKRDFWLDFDKDIPGFVSDDIDKILKNINKNKYNKKKIIEFAKKYVNIPEEGCSKTIVNLIKENI